MILLIVKVKLFKKKVIMKALTDFKKAEMLLSDIKVMYVTFCKTC